MKQLICVKARELIIANKVKGYNSSQSHVIKNKNKFVQENLFWQDILPPACSSEGDNNTWTLSFSHRRMWLAVSHLSLNHGYHQDD